MAQLTIDRNGIWADNVKKDIDYPDIGNSYSFTLEDNSFWFLHRNHVLLQVFKRFPFSKNFADIGGGNGFQAKFIADNFTNTNVFLIEPGYEGCLNGRKRGLANVYNTLFENFDFHKHDVTAVGMFDVVEHIENDTLFLQKLKDKLSPGSLIYITVPAYNFLWSDVDDLGNHHRRYTTTSMRALGERTGLSWVFGSYFFSYLPPLTFLLRSLPYRLKGKRKDDKMFEVEKDQHNPSPAVLKVFDYFQQRELKKLEHGSVGMGASVLAVFKT